MPALDSVEWEACLLEPVRNPERERAVRKALGFVPPGLRYFLDSPWFAEAGVALDMMHTPLLHVAPLLAEMVALVVSQVSACRYCFNVTRALLGVAGFPEERIRRIEDNLLGSEGDPSERAALQFAQRVAQSTPMVTAADAAPLRALGWSDAAVRELAAFAAVNVFFNRTATLPALPYAEADRPLRFAARRLIAPLLRPFLRIPRGRRPMPLPEAARRGAFAPIMNALDGLPVATRLRTAHDACLRSRRRRRGSCCSPTACRRRRSSPP
jgi:uncharacterized peroxidase-related enzyme